MSRRSIVSLMIVFALIVSACAADSGATTTAAPATTQAPPDDASDAGDETTETTEAAPVPEGPYEHLARAQAGEFAGTEVEVLAQWVDAESDNFEAAIQPFVDATGIDCQLRRHH